jgi:hypothetical protein
MLRLIELSRVTQVKMMMNHLLLLSSKLRRPLNQLKMPHLMHRNSSINTRLITRFLRRTLMMLKLEKSKK